MKVLISDNLSPLGVDILKKAGLEVDARSKTSPEEIGKIIGDYDALIIRSATRVAHRCSRPWPLTDHRQRFFINVDDPDRQVGVVGLRIEALKIIKRNQA